jgi:hypothetical protein
MTYQYYVETSHLDDSAISEAAAEAMRISEWQRDDESPDGVEYARGCDDAGNPVLLRRRIEESYEVVGPATYAIKFGTARVSFAGGPYDGEIVDSRRKAGWGSDPPAIFARFLSMCAMDGGDGTSIVGQEYSDGTNTYKINSVELKDDTLYLECDFVGKYVNDR